VKGVSGAKRERFEEKGLYGKARRRTIVRYDLKSLMVYR